MSLIYVVFLGITPAGLLMWVGSRLRPTANDEQGRKRWLFFLLGRLSLSLGAFLIANLVNTYTANLSFMTLLPITTVFFAELILYFATGLDHRSREIIKALPLFCLVVLLMTWVTISNTRETMLIILLGAILIALAWLAWDRAKKRFWGFYTVEILLLGFSIWMADSNPQVQMSSEWLTVIASFGTFAIIPGAGITMAALLIREPLLDEDIPDWRKLAWQVFLAAIPLALIAFQTILLSIWDVATDSVGGLITLLLTGIVTIGSAILMAWSMPRRRIWIAVLFSLCVPAIMQGAMQLGTYDKNGTWGTTPHIMTERRAESINKAIQQYYAGNQRYPQTLHDLTPRYILYIPNPYIIPGQDWCYEGGTDYYRFGYVFREFFSASATVKVYSSAGDPPAPSWACDKEAEKYPMPGFQQP